MRIFISLLLFMFFYSVSAANHIREFKSDSFDEIINENQQPFILVVWSLECPPCIKELSLLGEIQKKSNALKLILISTDSFADETEISQLLNQFELSSNDNWIFSNEIKQRLRYTIDPNWYGELPRSYFYKNQHSRIARSGALDRETLDNWLTQVSKLRKNQINLKLGLTN